MISRAPARKSLNLFIDKYGAGLSTGVFFPPDELFPPLEIMGLENYAVGGDTSNAIENRLDVAKLRESCLQGVRLECLNILIRALITRRINLKYFIVQDRSWSDTSSIECWTRTLDGFLKSFVGLENLVLQGDCRCKLPSLSKFIKHGETPQRMYKRSPWIFHILPGKLGLGSIAEKLQAMSKTCLHLGELTLDLERDEQSNGFVSCSASPFIEIDTS